MDFKWFDTFAIKRFSAVSFVLSSIYLFLLRMGTQGILVVEIDVYSFLVILFAFLQNDFNFEKKDWMTVKKIDFPSGSELVRNIVSFRCMMNVRCFIVLYFS